VTDDQAAAAQYGVFDLAGHAKYDRARADQQQRRAAA
jgi:hypothetical protein